MKNFARAILPGLAALMFVGPAAAQVLLVTPEEMRASEAAPDDIVAKSTPGPDAPRIELLQPDTSLPVSTPTRISLRFQATAPAEPRPESFRVYYGALGIDITSRLLGVAKVTKEGIQVEQVSLPKGSHKLNLFIEDTVGRNIRRTIAFSVD